MNGQHVSVTDMRQHWPIHPANKHAISEVMHMQQFIAVVRVACHNGTHAFIQLTTNSQRCTPVQLLNAVVYQLSNA